MKNVNVHHKMKNVNVHHYLFLSETYEPMARGTCPLPPPPPFGKILKAGFLVYFRIFVIFIWNYHYSTQLNRTKGRNYV